MEKVSQSLNNLLPMSVSNRALDFGCSGNQLVKKEAILNCCDNTWSSFLCILGLASVTNRNIFCYYPDCGEQRFKLLFNCKVEPCPPLRGMSDVHVLFCFQGIVESGKVFQPNHFVPLMFYEPTGGEKRKLPTQEISSNLQKSKSKKISSGNLVQSKISFPFVSTPDPKACHTVTKIAIAFVNLLNIGMMLLEILKNIQVNLVPHQHVYIAAQQKPFCLCRSSCQVKFSQLMC